MTARRVEIYIGFAAVCMIWGSSWAAVKLGLQDIPPLLALSLRFVIASIVLGSVMIGRKAGIPKAKSFWKLTLYLCLTSFTVPFIIIYYAQLNISSSLASVLFATFPFWVAIMSNIFLPDERMSPIKIAGIFIGFAGTFMIFFQGLKLTYSTSSLLGMVGIIIASILQGAALIILRRSRFTLDPVSMNFWPMLLSIIPIFVASVFTEDYSSVVYSNTGVLSLIYLSVFCTAFTFLIYFWLVKHLEAVVLSLSSFVSPVVAVIIGYFFLDEKLDASIMIGSVLVLAGIALVIANRRQASPAASSAEKESSRQ